MDPPVTRPLVENLLSLHRVGTLKAWDIIPDPGPRRRWRLTTTQGTWQLWLHAPAPFWALVLQADVARWVKDRKDQLAGVDACRHVPNLGGGHLFPWQGRFFSILEEPRGRQLAVFERSPDACAQVGAFLGAWHAATPRVRVHRRHPHAALRLRRMVSHLDGRADAAGVPLEELRRETEHVAGAMRMPGAHAVLLGAPGLEAFRFLHGTLCQLMPVEGASRGPALADVAHALLAWAWEGTAPDDARVAAFMTAYQQHRPLTRAEWRLLPAWLAHAALVDVLRTLRTWVVPQVGAHVEGWRDPGAPWRVFRALRDGPVRGLVRAWRPTRSEVTGSR